MYYARVGDAPIRTLAVAFLLQPSEVGFRSCRGCWVPVIAACCSTCLVTLQYIHTCIADPVVVSRVLPAPGSGAHSSGGGCAFAVTLPVCGVRSLQFSCAKDASSISHTLSPTQKFRAYMEIPDESNCTLEAKLTFIVRAVCAVVSGVAMHEHCCAGCSPSPPVWNRVPG